MNLKQYHNLRSHRLHWFVPFFFAIEDYHGRCSLLCVWRWGRQCWELWDWDNGIEYEFLDELRKKGATKSELYERIKFSANLRLRTTDWNEAKGARR